MLAGEALQPPSKGARVNFEAPGNARIIAGPFLHTTAIVAGLCAWRCTCRAEASEWLKKAPFENTEVEIRQVFEAEDFGDEFTPEARAQEDRIRQQLEAQK